MLTRSLRRRYLAALGLSGSVLSACSSNDATGVTPTTTTEIAAVPTSQPSTTAEPTTTAEPSATSTATSVPIATASASATPAGSVSAWAPVVVAPAPSGRPTSPPRATCPTGKFCVSEANASSPTQSPAPYAQCAQNVTDPRGGLPGHFDATQTQRERTKTSDACCYFWVRPCPGGRPLLVAGVARIAEPASSSAWSSTTAQLRHLERNLAQLPTDQRLALATHYTAEAAYEHASVAAFARVSLALLAVGAPPELVADTHRAALDEIEHAAVMYRLASAYRGASVGPGAVSLDGVTLQTSVIAIASEAFVEGCVGEVAAALVLREEAARAGDATTKRLCNSLASDEERHAELAWRTVSWALSEDPTSVRTCLLEARVALEAELASELPPETKALPFVTSARERIALRRHAIREVVLPCLDALLARDLA